MTKSEARKMARLEAENSELRDTIARNNSQIFNHIREACAYRVAIKEIYAVIEEAREFAK